MPKDGTWKFGDGEFESKVKELAKSGGQNWKNMTGDIAALVAKQIAEGRAAKAKKQKAGKKSGDKKNDKKKKK